MVGFLVAWLAVAGPGVVQAGATLHGTVIDAQTGAPVAQVTILIDGVKVAASDDRGEFTALVPAGPAPAGPRVELMVTAVGYGFVKRSLEIGPGRTEAGTIALNRESAALTELVTVTAASSGDVDAPLRALTKSDLAALSMVLVDDPLRSVHALPGVAANNDLRAEFSLRGASFDQIGIYVDGVRAGGFVHVLSDSGTTDQLSLSIVNQDTIASAALTPGVAPAADGGQTAGVLALETREGNRDRVTVHGSTGFVTTSGVVEGPLPAGKGSWLVAGRTTRADYVQQVVDRATRGAETPGENDLQFSDAHAKGVFDPTPRQQVGVSLLGGLFTNQQGGANHAEAVLEPNAVDRARAGNWLRSVNWRYTPGARVFAQVRLFGVGGTYREHNADGVSLTDNRRRGIGIRADATFQASSHHLARIGLYAQSAQEQARTTFFDSGGQPRQLGAFSATRLETSWYAEDRWSPSGRLTATGGVRVDRIASDTIASPRLRVALRLGRGWLVRGAAGVQAQAPPLAAVFGLLGNPALRASQSTEVDAGFEKAVSARMTFAIDVYRRHDRDHLFALAEPRLENGKVTAVMHPFQNSLEGRAHGIEAAIRRDSAARLSGWVGYAYGVTRFTDRLDNLSFPGDADQRHTLNAFGSFRLSGTLAASALWRYGSGAPRPGFLQPSGATLALGLERNTLRLPPYQRLDLKLRKVFVWGRSTFTLSAEVLNVLNRQNEYDVTSTLLSVAETGRYVSGLRESFRVTPAIGLSIRF
jgi:outer membrane receptor for ferrienterochelin and colicin